MLGSRNNSKEKSSSRQYWIWRILLPWLGISFFLYGMSRYNYLLFHSIAEGFAIVIACAVFMLAWNSRRIIDNSYLLLIGIAYLFVAIVDAVHTFAYNGMGVFPGHGPNLPTQLWVGARYLEAATLLIAPVVVGIKFTPWKCICVYAGITAILIYSVFTGLFPDCYVQGAGLTPFKMASEYVIVFLLLGSGVLLYLKRAAFDKDVIMLMLASIGCTILSEMFFTLYADPAGFFNLVGHCLKLLSFYLIYKAVIETGMAHPYNLLYRRLRDSERLHRSLIDNMTEGLAVHEVITDEKGHPVDYRFLDVNPAFEKLTGLDHEEIVGRRVLAVLPQTEKYWIEAYGHVALTGEPVHIENYSGALDRWFDAYAYRVSPGSFAVLFNDITDRKQVEEELLKFNESLERQVAERTMELDKRTKDLQKITMELTQAEERERQRLADILHDDLQQTLAYVKLRIQMLAGSLKDEDALTTDLNTLADALAGAIDTTRSLSQDLNPPFLHKKNLAPIIEQLAEHMRDRYDLEIETETRLGKVNLTKKQRVFIYRSVQELLFNAMKHSGGAKIRILLERENDGLIVSVEDDGVGFDASSFENEGSAGGGLGLFNIEGRVAVLGGSLEVESRPGEGCRFTLHLPLKPLRAANPPPAPEEKSETADEDGVEKKIRVLLVDDHAVLRQGLASLLQEESDMDVVGEAADGTQAFDLALEKKPDVILMDVDLGEMDGIDATRAITACLPAVRIIGLSIHAEEHVAAAMREAGAVDYLTKDGPSDDLVASIRSHAAREGKFRMPNAEF